MSYEVRPDGTIIAPDEASALRLSRKIRAEAEAAKVMSKAEKFSSGARHSRATPPRRQATAPSPVRAATEKKVAAMFRALAQAGKAGLRSEELARELDTTPKGIPPYAYAANKLIEERLPGVVGTEIFWRIKTRGKGTTWYVKDAEKLREVRLM